MVSDHKNFQHFVHLLTNSIMQSGKKWKPIYFAGIQISENIICSHTYFKEHKTLKYCPHVLNSKQNSGKWAIFILRLSAPTHPYHASGESESFNVKRRAVTIHGIILDSGSQMIDSSGPQPSRHQGLIS